MPPSRQRPPHLAVAAILLLVGAIFGLPRMLVVCSGPHCQARIEWAHRSERCCDGAHPVHGAQQDVHCDRAQRDRAPSCGASGHDHADADGGDGHRAQASHGNCTDVPFAVPLGPRPEPIAAPDLDPEIAVSAILPALPAPTATACCTHKPPATGPPRTDRRSWLRRTTVLLI